ncbi:MAG: hypothetical protein HYY45_11725 [Deltaproteobacteria bacterium]|nr:hypothetical protein [Deltaproteobacteria bacterium]
MPQVAIRPGTEKWPRTLLRWTITATAIFLGGCSLHRPILQEHVPGLGRFEFREPAEGMGGVVVGAPHGRTDRYSDRLARAISDRTGAGLAIAYGFRSKRISVNQPIVRSGAYSTSWNFPQRGSVFREYKKVLRRAAKGEIDLYIGVHRWGTGEADRIEVATSGLTFEEAMILKETYARIRDELVPKGQAPRLEMAIEPIERISWRVSGVKHHGVLLIAEKGLNIRLPQFFSSDSGERLYAEILSRWVGQVIVVLRENPGRLPQIQVQVTDLGRFELVESRKRFSGVVIGSPHGSYDEFTAEVVKRLSYRTGFAAVIAKGFTPTETGGTRINVNRPTEKLPYSEGREIHSRRATETYHAFKDLVFAASSGDLELYIDIHQYNTDSKIQVATVGISQREAKIIKKIYGEIRDQTLKRQSHIPVVELLIEPLDEVEIGAWAAKIEGILGQAKKSLHFELPGEKALTTSETREAYTRILAALLRESAPILASRAKTLIR